MGRNYPAEWNRKNVRNKTVRFVAELQELCDKYGLYVENAESDAGCANIVDRDGLTVATDFVLNDDKKYYGLYQELVGELPEGKEADED